jgi:hypothetical protein
MRVLCDVDIAYRPESRLCDLGVDAFDLRDYRSRASVEAEITGTLP